MSTQVPPPTLPYPTRPDFTTLTKAIYCQPQIAFPLTPLPHLQHIE